MVDYETMYAMLCAAASEAIDVLDGAFIKTEQMCHVREILQNALDRAEQIYCDEEISVQNGITVENPGDSLDIFTLTC